MSLTKGTIPQRLAETLVIDTVLDSSSPVNDAFDGFTLGNRIFSLKLDNSAINAVTYFKGQLASASQYDTTTAPDLKFYVPANSILEVVYPSGWPANSLTGTDKFHFLGTSTADGTGAQADPTGGSFKVTVLAGTAT
tara:strand:+ start:973 stop:1383 length:411 start_codon:yes stop_codon:yes gene_type:complete